MFLFLSLFILSKSTDFDIDFSKSYYDLFLNSTGVFVRNATNSNSDEKKVVYTSTNIKDHTVHLNISVKFTNDVNVLDIHVDLFKLNLDLKITCLNTEKITAGIRTHDAGNSEIEYYNYYKVTIHSNTIFYFDTENWAYAMIESYNLNSRLTGRLSPLDFFYDSHSYICYRKEDCLNHYSIGPFDSYFIASDDEMYESVMNNVPLNEDNTFYILLNGNFDFPGLNGILGTTETSDVTFHLTGISEDPVKLTINSEISCDKNIVFSNVQLIKAQDAEQPFQLHFNTITVDDETENVFQNGLSIKCEKFYEYRTNSKESQFTSIEGTRCFYISPDFETNGDVFLNVKNDIIEVKNSKDEIFATIPKYENIEVHIENQKNLNHNKIVIKNGLESNQVGSIGIYFENCGQIPIEFRDWGNEKLSEFKFSINNDMYEIYDEIITNTNSPYLSYDVIKGESKFSFPNDAQQVVICLPSDTCSESEHIGNHVYQYPISGDKLDAELKIFLEKYTSIQSLTLVLKNELNTLDLPKVYNSISFINNEKTSLQITLSFTEGDRIEHMEIRNCQITANSALTINQLFVSEGGSINEDSITVQSKTELSEKNIDISNNDETITLTGTSNLKLLVKSGNSPHKLIFKTSAQVECTVYIQSCDGSYMNIPISFSEEQSTSTNTLEIITLNNERIVFTSVPANIKTTVKSNNNVQYHIPAKSNECNQDKVSICYNNNNCGYEYGDDEMYFSSINENDFTAVINLLKQDQTKTYQYIRLLFNPDVSVYEDVKFSQIPANQVKQLRLSSISPDPEGVYLVLNDNTETRNIKNWIIDPFVFFWRGKEDKLLYFDNISNDFSSVTNSEIDIEDKIIEITDNLYNNYYIETFHVQSDYASVYYYLSGSNLVDNFGMLVFDIANDECLIQYNENVTIGSEDKEYNKLTNPKDDLSKIYLQIKDNEQEKQVINIKRIDGTINQTNLIISKATGSVSIEFTCEEESEASYFELNLYLMNIQDINVEINKGTCKDVRIYEIPYTNENINDAPIPENTQSSTSSTFEFTNEGYISKEKGEIKRTSIPDKSQINKILFTNRFITLSEIYGYNSDIPLYFVSNLCNSKITIKENIVNSNIGVTSYNSPRVELEKSTNPLSFLNEEINGGSIELLYQLTDNLILNEMNNLQGPFSLIVSTAIKNVSFADIKMSQKSSFEITKEVSSSSAKRLQSEDETIIHARNSVNISSNSEITIKNLQLDGIINMNDDSILNLAGITKFSDKSKIDLTVQTSKSTNLLINCENALDTVPSSINVILNVTDKKIKIDDLKIIGPLSSLELCNELGKRTTVEGAKKLKVSPKCTETNGKIELSTSIKTKNKLSGGAIAGIVIACVVVLAIIIGLIVFFVMRRKIAIPTSEEQNENDYSCGL